MNYLKIYNKLIEYRLLNSNLIGQYHHIIPHCIGGKQINNIVKLSYKQHWIAHKLLTKIYPKQGKLIMALWMMSNSKRRKINIKTSNQYKLLREKIIFILKKQASNKMWIYNIKTFQSLMIKKQQKIPDGYIKGRNPFTIQNMKKPKSIIHYGKIMSKQTKQKLRIAHLNKPLSQEHKKNISGHIPWNKGIFGQGAPMYNKYHSEQTKQKMSLAAKGRILSQQSIIKMKQTKKLNPCTPWLGRHLSEQHKQKIRQAHLKRKKYV